MTTHEVLNQSTPLVGHNAYANDVALQAAVQRHGANWAAGALEALGARVGSADVQDWARLANAHPPTLRGFDRNGRRIDEIEFHPAWHALMDLLVGSSTAGAAWAETRAGAQVARAAAYLLLGQAENGAQCPVTMTYAAVPLLRAHARNEPAFAADWMDKLLGNRYDGRSVPVADKYCVLIGMGMTEKQGGSDVRSNSTFAEPLGRGAWGKAYRITGHKWFFSAPQSDAHLVLAQTERGSAAGLSCFFVPRWLPSADGEAGSRNAIIVQRLKDKLGNRSNASAEVEFDGATGYLVGDVGRGIPTILEMGNLTRLDCALGSAGILRAAVTTAIHHARGRSAFGRRLAEQPLMRNVLADLALESEAAMQLSICVAAAVDAMYRAEADGTVSADARARARLRVRLLTPIAKYWICKRGLAAGAEAMEVLGGNGYVEEAPLARWYRELPVNSIWEGSGNVISLDLLRGLTAGDKTRERCVELLAAEFGAARGAEARFDVFVQRLLDNIARLGGDAEVDAWQARRLTERLAVAWQASLLVAAAPPAVADAFCAARLGADPDGAWAARSFGTLPAGADSAAIVARALPA